jgi:type IV secretory pathway VirB4 component
LVVAPGHAPADDLRRVRRAAWSLEREFRDSLERARRERQLAEWDQARANPQLPANGEARPEAGRSWWRLRLEPHRATSDVLAVAYPFLAEEGLGSAGVLVGVDYWSGTAFVYDPFTLYERKVLTNPNMLVAGQVGRGKSMFAKSFACRQIAFGRRVYVPGDVKGEWSVVAEAAGGAVIHLGVGRRARLNPLDEGPRPSRPTDSEWAAQVTKRRRTLLAALAEAASGRSLEPTERTALDSALDEAVQATTPILTAVVAALHEPSNARAGATLEQLRDDGRRIAHALDRLVHGDLAGLFDGPSTVVFDPGLPMVSLDLSAIGGDDTLTALLMTCAGAWMEAALADPEGGKRLVVYDEAWHLMRQPALLARMQAQWKLSRAWGLANMLIIHRLSDLEAVGDDRSEARGLAQGLLGDTATRILYMEPFDEAVKAGHRLGLSSVEMAQLPDLPQGHGLWRVNDRSFIVHHLVTPDERAVFNTDQRMVRS